MAARRGFIAGRRRPTKSNQPVFAASGVFSIDYELLSLSIAAESELINNELELEFDYGVEAYSGDILDLAFDYDVSATAQYDNTGQLAFTYTLVEFDAEAATTETGTFTADWDLIDVQLYGGPALDIDYELIEFDAAADYQYTATATFNFGYEFSSAATAQVGSGYLDIDYELFKFDDAGYVTLDFGFKFEGAADTTIAPPAETYVVNLTTGAISRYRIGFEKYFRLGDKHFGLDSVGDVYELTGGTDAGSSIWSVALTHPSDFGSSKEKNVPKVYIDARAEDGLMLQTVVDEANMYRYQSTKLAAAHANNQPVKLKRGIRGMRWAFELRNLSGEQATVQSLEPVVELRERKLEK